jgi:phosphatidate cytidylyltransferase
VFIAAVVGWFWLDAQAPLPGLALAPLALGLALVAAHELLAMMAAGDLRPRPGVVYAGTFGIVLSSVIAAYEGSFADAPLARLAWPLFATLLALVVAFLGEMRRYEKPGRVTRDLGATVFAFLYVGLLLSMIVQLRCLGGGASGLWGLATLIVVVKLGDIGAYTVGRLVGRHKMAPTLSPGKTWEGVAGALAFSACGAWLAIVQVGPELLAALAPEHRAPTAPAGFWIAYGVMVGGLGIVGDLAESLLKRDLGVKDSSRWMPGFGGVLDILDSLLLTAPAGYLFWLWLLRAPATA